MKKLISAFLLGTTPMIATGATDPFGPTLQLLNQAITTQQLEILQSAPTAKNESFEELLP